MDVYTKMAKQSHKQEEEGRSSSNNSINSLNMNVNIDALGEDLLNNILQRLPALSCASAACVSRSWNYICSRILSFPKLSSAFSLNPSLQGAVNEVLDKVLSEPIRPQFALASIGPAFSLQEAHQLITGRLGSQIPVITSVPQGIIGRSALDNEFKEIQWEVAENEDLDDNNATLPSGNRGILLTIGHLPGLKATLITMRENMALRELLNDEFVTNVIAWTSSVSDSSSPAGMILYCDWETDMKPVLEKLDYAFSAGTGILGDSGSQFLYQGEWGETSSGLPNCHSVAVALVFARDRNTPRGSGETQLHVMVSTGTSPVGPTFKAASVKERKSECSTWLTARRESVRENLDGQSILDHIYDEIGDRQYPAFYVGVTKRRKCSIAESKVVRWMTFLEYHEVLGGDEEYLFLNDVGIKTGDSFRFYLSNSSLALSTCRNVSEKFRHLKQYCDHQKDRQSAKAKAATGSDNKLVFGGIMFACCGRGEPLFGQANVDSMPFLENFPGTTLSGLFCSGEIGRESLSFGNQESEKETSAHCLVHVFSTAYLVLSYKPPST